MSLHNKAGREALAASISKSEVAINTSWSVESK
jgi:hypothetical protein